MKALLIGRRKDQAPNIPSSAVARRTIVISIVAMLFVIGAASAYVTVYRHREKTISLSFLAGDQIAPEYRDRDPLELTNEHIANLPSSVIAGLEAALASGSGRADLNAKQEAQYLSALGERREEGTSIPVVYKGVYIYIGAQRY